MSTPTPKSDTPLSDGELQRVMQDGKHRWPAFCRELERENAALRDLLLRIRREPALTTRGGAGGADNYTGMPRCYPLIDAALNIPWQA